MKKISSNLQIHVGTHQYLQFGKLVRYPLNKQCSYELIGRLSELSKDHLRTLANKNSVWSKPSYNYYEAFSTVIAKLFMTSSLKQLLKDIVRAPPRIEVTLHETKKHPSNKNHSELTIRNFSLNDFSS